MPQDTETTPSGRPRRGFGRWLGRAVALAVLVATFAVLQRRAAGLDVVDDLPHLVWLVGAVAVNVAGNVLLIDAWRVALGLTGHDLSRMVATDVWGSSQLTRLLVPGAPVASRAVLGRRHGVPAGIGALATLVEMAWMLVGTPILALVTAPWWLPAASGSGDASQLGWLTGLAVVPLAGLAAILWRPRRSLDLLARTLARLPVLGRRLEPTAEALHDAPFDRRAATAMLWRYAGATTTRLASFLLLTVGVIGADGTGEHLAVIVGGFAIGRFVGAAAVFAPGGIGPREGATALVLEPTLGAAPVLVVIALARLVEFVAELLMLAVVKVAVRR